LPILLNTVAPVFGIMLLGFVAVRAGMLEEAGVKGLVLYVFNFAIPLLLFRSLATTQLPEDIRWSFIFSFYGGSFACYGLGMAMGRVLFRRTLDHQAIFGMAAGFSNTVPLAIPIIITAYGPDATLPILLLIAFHGPTLMPLTTTLIQIHRGSEVSATQQVRAVGMELVRNPIIMGLLFGLVANLSGIALPGGLDRTVELIGSSAVPCALFAMGASLASYPLFGDVAPAVALATVKLFLHPLFVWILAVPVFGLEGIWVPVAVTMAAMPTGVNAYLFGARYDAAPGVAARTILLGTIIGVGTISTVLLLFHGG
jgi:predicted permease